MPIDSIDGLDDGEDNYEDSTADVEAFIAQNPGATATYVSESLRVPLSAVESIMGSLFIGGRP